MNRFDANAKFRRAVALEQVEKPAPSQRVKATCHTRQYEHSSDVGFVTSTSDHFAAGVTIEELLDVSRDAAAVTILAIVRCHWFVVAGVIAGCSRCSCRFWGFVYQRRGEFAAAPSLLLLVLPSYPAALSSVIRFLCYSCQCTGLKKAMPLATALVTALKTRDAAVQASGCAQYLEAFESGREGVESKRPAGGSPPKAPT